MDLPKVGAKIEGEIGDLLAKLQIAKTAVRDFKKDATTSAQLRIASDMEKELNRAAKSLKSGIIRNAMKDALRADDIAAREGESAAKAFARAWRAQMKKETGVLTRQQRGLLPLIGIGMGVAPAAGAGALGIAGGLATAGVGAAAGLGALAISAKSVLQPVQQAFQAVSKLAESNQVLANATALRTWMGGTTTKTTAGSSAFSATGLQQRIAAEQLRIQATQSRLSSATTPSARLNARATLLTQQNILSGLQTRLAAGPGGGTTVTANQLPAGMGFLANPNVNWYTMSQAQRRRTILTAQTPMTGDPTAMKDQVRALMQERQAYIGLDAGQRKALYSYQMFSQALEQSKMKAQPIVLALFAKGLQILTPLLKYLNPLASAAGHALMFLFDQIGKVTKSTAFKDFMAQLTKMASVGVKGFGQVLINVGVGLMHIFTAFSKSGMAQSMLDGLVKASQHFATWTGGKGFAKFMNDMKTNAPVVGQLLRNLGKVLGDLAGSMTGGFGTAELKLLSTFFGIIAWAAKIPGVGSLIYNLIALELIFSRFGSIKATTALLDLATKALGRMAALKFGGFLADLLKIENRGKTVGSLYKAIGGKVWTGVKAMGSALGSAVASATKWMIGMLARMGSVVAGWVAGWLGLDIATAAGSAAAIAASGGILLAIGLLVIGIYELVKHWKTVWGWIKKISKEAWDFIWNGFGKYLLPLLGPVGMIALGVIEVWKHWKSVWNALTSFTKWILKHIVDMFAGWAIGILKAANFAFGWIPGIGPNLKKALAHIQDFKNSVDRTLGGLHNHNIAVGVAFRAAQSGHQGPSLAFPKAAAGMYIGSGRAGIDDQLILAQRGEVVVPTRMVKGGAVDHLKGQIPGFAQGGQVGSTGVGPGRPPGVTFSTTTPNAGQVRNTIDGAIRPLVIAFAKSMFSGASSIVQDAMRWIGKIPYVWGGTAVPGGADCSGFVQTIYGRHGISAPRTSEAQGMWVRRSGPTPGGLAFYHSPPGGPDPGHVAIIGYGGKVISQGGGMGPQLMGLHSMPLLWTGIPPHGFPGGGRVRGFGGGFTSRSAAIAEGRAMAAQRGWTGIEWTDLFNLWQRESTWNPKARNPSSGAAGIPQDITGNFHGGTAGQIAWGLNYIAQRYRDPRGAWAHELRFGWYGSGTMGASPGWGVVGERGPEFVKFHGGEQVVPMRGRGVGPAGGHPIVIYVTTQEIRPQYHAAKLGFELARRVSK